MNIFILDKSPEKSAQMMCDVHVRKMLVEAAQMLSIAAAYHMGAIADTVDPWCKRHYLRFRVGMIEGINKYTKSQASHPCSLWARTCKENALWLIDYACYMAKEYEHRFDKKPEKSLAVIARCRHLLDKPGALKTLGYRTRFYTAVAEEFRSVSVVGSYRRYYAAKKQHLLKYTRRETPRWLKAITPKQKKMK